MEPLRTFHRVVLAGEFLADLAPAHWPPGQRSGWCWLPPTDSHRMCTMKEGSRTVTKTKIMSLIFWVLVYRERNVLFNDALNTFYLRLYGVRHMVKDHSDSEKGNPLLPHRLLLSINSMGSFICTIPQTG